MENDMKPANDPNASPALAAAAPVVLEVTPPVGVAPVEPAVTPPAEPATAAPVEPVQPAAPVEPAPVVPEVPAIPEPPVAPAPEVPAYVPETYTNFMEAADKLLTDKGIDTKSLAATIDAADGKVTDEVRGILVDKLGAAQATVLISGYETEHAAATASVNAEANKVFDVVGGKEMWDKMAAWAASPEAKLTEEARQSYNTMLSLGGVQAALAAEAIKGAYMQSPGFTQDPTLLTGDKQPNAPTGIEPISRSVYMTEKTKAINENNGVEVQSLEARARFTKEHHTAAWYGARYNG